MYSIKTLLFRNICVVISLLATVSCKTTTRIQLKNATLYRIEVERNEHLKEFNGHRVIDGPKELSKKSLQTIAELLNEDAAVIADADYDEQKPCKFEPAIALKTATQNYLISFVCNRLYIYENSGAYKLYHIDNIRNEILLWAQKEFPKDTYLELMPYDD